MHFPTNTHARTHTHPPAQKVENIHRRRQNDGRSAVALWVFPTGGVLHEGGGHTPQLTVFEKNVVRGHRDSASRLRLLLFFQIEKQRNAPTVSLDRGHSGRDVTEASSCRPGTLFFVFFTNTHL